MRSLLSLSAYALLQGILCGAFNRVMLNLFLHRPRSGFLQRPIWNKNSKPTRGCNFSLAFLLSLFYVSAITVTQRTRQKSPFYFRVRLCSPRKSNAENLKRKNYRGKIWKDAGEWSNTSTLQKSLALYRNQSQRGRTETGWEYESDCKRHCWRQRGGGGGGASGFVEVIKSFCCWAGTVSTKVFCSLPSF